MLKLSDRAGLLASVLLSAFFSTSSFAYLHAKIETVKGAATVLLQTGISLREAKPGEEIQAGERVRTDSKTTVLITYADGTQLEILPNTDLEVEKPQGAVQSNHLRGGWVKGDVQKAPEVDGAAAIAAPTKPVIKYIIRTKTATMGVRGTEFVVSYQALSGLTQFHTLEGTVEVATDPAEVLSGEGVPVGGGHFVQATPDAGLGPVRSFNVPKFLGDLESLASSPEVSEAARGTGAQNVEMRNAPAAQAVPAPKPPAPAASAPPLPIALAEEKRVEEEKERPRAHLISFALGYFFSPTPDPDKISGTDYYRMLELNWTPSIPLPYLGFIYLRGSLGMGLFQNFSLNNGSSGKGGIVLTEYEAFVGTSLLSPLFLEAGGGIQAWRAENFDAHVLGFNTGLILSPNGRFNRLYAGASKLFAGAQPLELHVGIGIQIF